MYVLVDGESYPCRAASRGQSEIILYLGENVVLIDGTQVENTTVLSGNRDYAGAVTVEGEWLEDHFEQEIAGQKATRIMFRALAQTDVIKPADALDNAGMFPQWAEHVGTDTKVGEYLRHDNGLYRVKQSHKIQAHYPPSTATAALYSRVTMPGDIPGWSPGSWAKDVKVKHKGKIWLSMVDNNTWEPGSPGVYDNIWKEALS